MAAPTCGNTGHLLIGIDKPSSTLLNNRAYPGFCCHLTFADRGLQPLPVRVPSSVRRGWKLCDSKRLSNSIQCAVDGGGSGGLRRESSRAIDDKPFEVLPGGKISYLDEEDIVTFLDPPKPLIPLDPSSFNPASYLWKKIEDIPEERRHRLLSLLNPRLITRAWEIAGARYQDPVLVKKIASSLLSDNGSVKALEFWRCRTTGGPWPIGWINFFNKVLFHCKDEKTCGRFIGGSLLGGILSSFYPMYFRVTQLKEVMATEQPCDLAYEFGDGLLDLHDYPEGFPKPAKHPWPFNDQAVVYIRHVGPGVLVGQAWQEGEELQQVPRKLCNEILMVKDYPARC